MSDLRKAIEKAIVDHCAGGDLALCAMLAAEPFDAELAERDETIRKLRDPVFVHVAMLKGIVAVPPLAEMLHIYGATFSSVEAANIELAKAREMIRQLTERAEAAESMLTKYEQAPTDEYREYKKLCRVEDDPGVSGLAHLESRIRNALTLPRKGYQSTFTNAINALNELLAYVAVADLKANKFYAHERDDLVRHIAERADELERLRAENARKSAQSTQQWEA